MEALGASPDSCRVEDESLFPFLTGANRAATFVSGTYRKGSASYAIASATLTGMSDAAGLADLKASNFL